MTNLSLVSISIILSTLIIGGFVVYHRSYKPTGYEYFISFSHKGGFGNGSIELSVPITNISHTKLIAKELNKDPELEGVVVLNYSLLGIVRGRNDRPND